MKKLLILLMMVVFSTFVFADTILIHDDFEDGVFNDTLWINNTYVGEKDGYMWINGTGSPFSNVRLKESVDYSNGSNYVFRYEVVTNSDGGSYITGIGSYYTWNNYRSGWFYLGSDPYGQMKDDGTGTIATNEQFSQFEYHEVRMRWNSTHFSMFKPTQSTTNIPSGLEFNSSIWAVANGGWIQIYEFTACIDDDNDFNCTLPQPPSIPNMSIEWDNLDPLDGVGTSNSPLTFEINITDPRSDVNCSLYTNQTGTFTINETRTGLSDGISEINFTAPSNTSIDYQFLINCNDNVSNLNTSTKTITIDFVNVLIDVVYPSDGLSIYNETTSFNLDIDYYNINLDHIYYRVFLPNGTLLQENSTTVGSGYYNYADPLNLPVIFGTYTINAYGNDSIGNSNNISTSFEYLERTLSVDWELLTPPNGTTIYNQSIYYFGYDVTMSNIDSVTCRIKENGDTKNTQIINTTGTYNISVSYATSLITTKDYNVECSGFTMFDTTSTKTISIENIAVATGNFGFLALVPLLVIVIFLIISIKAIMKEAGLRK